MKEEDKNILLSGKWIGYYWLSDATKPEVMTTAVALSKDLIDEKRNPFVVEANFVSEDGAKSVFMTHVDGHLRVTVTDTATPEGAEDEEENLVAHRMDGVAKLRFVRRWVRRDDELCLGWPSLVPERRIFKGFELKSNGEKAE